MKANRFNFRAWDGRKMLGQGKNDFFSIRNDGRPSFSEDVVLMQSTGLTDKNGVEIFEGDIVMWSKESNLCPEETWCGPSPVRWDHSEYDIDGCGMPYKSYEVIGNIHENPELLETT